MPEKITIGTLVIDVVQKDIKNIHLSVKPPLGAVFISAPLHLTENAIRAFAIGKLVWIKQQQAKLRSQVREMPREYLERESHYFWGKRYLLKIVEQNAASHVEVAHNTIVLSVRPKTSVDQMAEIMEKWYRDQLRVVVSPLITKWQNKIGVEAKGFHVQRMKTRWGSCSFDKQSIRLNTDLAKKPQECLEYILVHELVHLIEPTHNAVFIGLMDRFLPNWPHRRDQLNQLPVRHADWDY